MTTIGIELAALPFVLVKPFVECCLSDQPTGHYPLATSFTNLYRSITTVLLLRRECAHASIAASLAPFCIFARTRPKKKEVCESGSPLQKHQ